MRIRKIGDYQYKGTCGFYAEADATETTTFKCEGCGKRRRTQDELPAGCLDAFSVCSPPCLVLARAQYDRQRYDNRILALVGN